MSVRPTEMPERRLGADLDVGEELGHLVLVGQADLLGFGGLGDLLHVQLVAGRKNAYRVALAGLYGDGLGQYVAADVLLGGDFLGGVGRRVLAGLEGHPMLGEIILYLHLCAPFR